MKRDTKELEIDGDLTGKKALETMQKLERARIACGQDVRLGFGQVSEIDASGLALLIRLGSQLKARGGELRLSRVRTPVHETLHRIGAAGVFSIEDEASEVIEVAEVVPALN